MPLTAAQLSVKVSADTAGAESGLRSMGRAANEAGGGLKSALSNMLQFAGGQMIFQELSDAVSGLEDRVKDFLATGFNFDSTMEHLHAQLTAITGSGKTADQMIDWVKKMGQTVPDTTEHLASATVTIQSLGLNAESVMPNLANVAAAMGVDLPTAAQAFSDAYEGRFQMMQMNLHVTKAQLEKFGLSTKNIQGTLPQAFAAFQKAKFPHGLQAAMGTFQGQVSNLTDRYQMLAGQVMQPVFKGVEKDLLKLFDIMDKHKKTINTIATAIGSFLGGALSTVVNWALQLAKQFGDLTGKTGGLGKQFSWVGPVVKQLGDFFAKVVLPAVQQFAGFVMSNVVPAVMQIAKWFGEHVLPIIEQVAAVFFQDVLPAYEQFYGAVMKRLIPPLERLWNILAPSIVPAFQLLGSVLKNIVAPILSHVIDIIGWLLDRIGDLAQALAPIMKAIGNFESAASGALGGVGDVLNKLPHFAMGGTMANTGYAIVGENGPELVKLPGGAQVYSNPSALAGGMSMISGQHITIEVPVKLDGREVARSVVRHAPSIIRQATGVRGM